MGPVRCRKRQYRERGFHSKLRFEVGEGASSCLLFIQEEPGWLTMLQSGGGVVRVGEGEVLGSETMALVTAHSNSDEDGSSPRIGEVDPLGK